MAGLLGADLLQRPHAADLCGSACARSSIACLFIVRSSSTIGMWLERFVIVVTSLHRDFLPSSWGMYYPTLWDWSTFIGTIGFFLTLLFLFIRFLPMISIFEMRTLLPRGRGRRRSTRERAEPQAAHLRTDGRVRQSGRRWSRACRAAREAGYRRWTPIRRFPIEGSVDALGSTRTRLPLLVLCRRHSRRPRRLRSAVLDRRSIDYPIQRRRHGRSTAGRRSSP